jgi:hypothetical protein
MVMRKGLVLLGALAMGLATGWLDFHATEVQGTVLLILAGSFGFSLIVPELAWLIALFMGGGVYAVAAAARGLGLQPVDPIPSNPWWAAIVLPLVFAFAAAYAAYFARRTLAKTQETVNG